MSFPLYRARRLRRTPQLRALVRETSVRMNHLIYPIFVDETIDEIASIPEMPGQNRVPLGTVDEEIRHLVNTGVRAFLIFGIPNHKDEVASGAYSTQGVVQLALKRIRGSLGNEALLATDVCLCEYTDNGHCGIMQDGVISNDSTLEILAKIAVSHANAGADIVAPSAMMDGQVKTIREVLDQSGLTETAIMAYSAKHTSSFYAPFRGAAQSFPHFGGRESHQMDFHNPNEAMREIRMDIEEGADIVMIKPALGYLDIIHRASQMFDVPIAAYNVSGEYAMVKVAAERKILDERSTVHEILSAIRRAGAGVVITYHARDMAQWLNER